MTSIFEAIIKDDIYFDHFLSYTKPHSYGTDRIILDLVAFEREFRNFYDENVERSEEYIQIKKWNIRILKKNLKMKKQGKRKNMLMNFTLSRKNRN